MEKIFVCYISTLLSASRLNSTQIIAALLPSAPLDSTQLFVCINSPHLNLLQIGSTFLTSTRLRSSCLASPRLHSTQLFVCYTSSPLNSAPLIFTRLNSTQLFVCCISSQRHSSHFRSTQLVSTIRLLHLFSTPLNSTSLDSTQLTIQQKENKMYERSEKTRKLCEIFRSCNGNLSYETICNEMNDTKENLRPTITRVVKMLERDEGIVFGNVRTVGYRRLTDGEKVHSLDGFQRKIRRNASNGTQRAHTVSDRLALSNDEQLKLQLKEAAFMAISKNLS